MGIIQNGMATAARARRSRQRRGAMGLGNIRGHMSDEAEYQERRLNEQPALKNYGKISVDLKNEKFETIKVPQAVEAVGEDLKLAQDAKSAN